jgi:hypothetical protein
MFHGQNGIFSDGLGIDSEAVELDSYVDDSYLDSLPPATAQMIPGTYATIEASLAEMPVTPSASPPGLLSTSPSASSFGGPLTAPMSTASASPHTTPALGPMTLEHGTPPDTNHMSAYVCGGGGAEEATPRSSAGLLDTIASQCEAAPPLSSQPNLSPSTSISSVSSLSPPPTPLAPSPADGSGALGHFPTPSSAGPVRVSAATPRASNHRKAPPTSIDNLVPRCYQDDRMIISPTRGSPRRRPARHSMSVHELPSPTATDDEIVARGSANAQAAAQWALTNGRAARVTKPAPKAPPTRLQRSSTVTSFPYASPTQQHSTCGNGAQGQGPPPPLTRSNSVSSALATAPGNAHAQAFAAARAAHLAASARQQQQQLQQQQQQLPQQQHTHHHQVPQQQQQQPQHLAPHQLTLSTQCAHPARGDVLSPPQTPTTPAPGGAGPATSPSMHDALGALDILHVFLRDEHGAEQQRAVACYGPGQEGADAFYKAQQDPLALGTTGQYEAVQDLRARVVARLHQYQQVQHPGGQQQQQQQQQRQQHHPHPHLQQQQQHFLPQHNECL